MKFMSLPVLLLLFPLLSFSQPFQTSEIATWKKMARYVTIIRDSWGIPHIYGNTDADAVFGLMYAQCEENFPRIERNYLEIMGRLSEIEGKSFLYDDLQMRLIYDSAAAIADYHKAPPYFKKLLDAFAAGINFYLATHPKVKPLILKRFQPWYALLYTDGSISPTQTADLTTQDVQELYPIKDLSFQFHNKPIQDTNPSGSNGFAIAPSRSASGHALLYINPHVTFYFRSEAQMVSNEGLNAYGAVTWGQFFVYQGFNQHNGWMHTSSHADVADLYKENISKRNDSLFYQYDNKWLPVTTKQISIRYKSGNIQKPEQFVTYSTHHGPVMGSRNNIWLSLKENNRSLNSLMQSWLRTKTNGFEEFKKVMDMRANNSNNTVFADDKGNIAYWHGNFMPARNSNFDWSLPVDGTTSATEWKGLHKLDEIVHIYNPSSGYIQNCNSTPFTAAGESSPDPTKFPLYMAPDGENFRAVNAQRLLASAHNLTIDKLINTIGYDHYLAGFEVLLPPLLKAFDELEPTDSLATSLREAILLLRSWNRRSDVNSIATTLAIEWGSRILRKGPSAKTPEAASNALATFDAAIQFVSNTEKLQLLDLTLKDLASRFGTWLVPWGEINRYQRKNDDSFNDDDPSLPVGLAASTWGSLPSFVSRRYNNSNNRYGYNGNSFIAAVEFGPKLKAKTVITGGQSFDPHSPHFMDQAQMFLDGKFKDVWFYKEDVLKHAVKKYHPGE